MVDLTTLAITAAICLGIGFFLGLLVSSLRTGKGEDPGQRTVTLSGREAKAGIYPAIRALTTPPPLDSASHAKGSMSPVNPLASARQPTQSSRTASQKSIASQVDEILQEKIDSLPAGELDPDQRATRLLELPGKGMVVMVGLNQYEGVEAVPDASIRKLISQAVAEWERRVDPGDKQ